MVGRTISIRFGNLSKKEEERIILGILYTRRFGSCEWKVTRMIACGPLTFFISWQWQWHTDVFFVFLPRETFG